MSPLDLFHLTYQSLRGNLLRSVLSGFGVFMGVAAVSATLEVGNISRAVIAQQLREREAPQINIYPRWQRSGFRRFRVEDMEFLQQRLSGWQAISTSMWVSAEDSVFFQDRQANPEKLAVSEQFLLTSGRALLSGRFFSQTDFDNYRPVIVIDNILAGQLFGEQDPVGKRLYSGGRAYVIVGVIEGKLNPWAEEEPPGLMLTTTSFHRASTGRRRIGSISVRPERIEDLDKLQERATKLFQQRYPDREFDGWSNVEDIIEQQTTLDMAAKGLLAVGVIALLVGGVGIANITIASVVERTPEIGLRRAIGAKSQDILLQFILEAALLSMVGGVSAIATVHGVTTVVAQTFELPYEFDRHTAVLALGSALLVGVGAGFFPALRASQLDPVQALRAK